ncbi:hypothetical protein E1286_04900 [Nonomuraea terrae]|uniref:Uncharacterized protein n=1 Tax=Nonomuraea terrae TaxID=2530383 RepID=A0A4R4Z8B4_9ACTN|nr:hypothetical protein [Nonomuraea terrae]TDD54531.1 hypothetical protein E1286_04900 [Nonomuraea terrae]
MTPPVRYNAREAGKLLGKSADWMYKKGAAGEIPRSQLGHHVFWTPQQIEQILRSAEQPAKQTKPAEKSEREQQRSPQPPKREVKRRRPPATTNANIPVADRSVSRLYRQESTA